MTYNTEGIILKYRDIGEFDRIYSILTREHGKVEAWAQGVRKPQSKLVAHLQPLYLCDLMFARGRRFDRVAQVCVLNRWPAVWSNLSALAQAMYVASLVDLVTRPGTREMRVFALVAQYLETNSLESRFQRIGLSILTIFSLKLLKESGFAPELHLCVVCKEEVGGLSVQFDAGRGGVVCTACVNSNVESIRQHDQPFGWTPDNLLLVSSLTLDTLETILNSPLSHLEMPEAVARELDKISEAMVAAHFGEEPRSRAFVDFLAKQPLVIQAEV